MFCNKCGTKLDSGSHFCPKCGNNLNANNTNNYSQQDQNLNNNSNQFSGNYSQNNQINSVNYNQINSTNNMYNQQNSNFNNQNNQINYNQQNLNNYVNPNQYAQSNYNYNNYVEPNYNYNQQNSQPKKEKNSWIYLIIGGLVVIIIVILLIPTNSNSKGYYFSNEGTEVTYNKSVYRRTTADPSIYVSSYVGNLTDYKNQLTQISNAQKANCQKSSTLKYEKEMMEKYGLYTANLCELSDTMLEKILEIYAYAEKEYKGIFDYAYASQSLYNADSQFAKESGFESGVIAFYGAIPSANSNAGLNVKTMMGLSSTYFLNEPYFGSVVNNNVQAKHFPANTNIYSPVMHELGHKLHFDLVFKKYGIDNISIVNSTNIKQFYRVLGDINSNETSAEIVKKAIKNIYNVDATNVLEYTKEISGYAASSINESIAESVHDYYLNGQKANKLSLEIVKILKEERSKYFR